MENWHPLKVCATFQGHSPENYQPPAGWIKFPLLSQPYARFLQREERKLLNKALFKTGK